MKLSFFLVGFHRSSMKIFVHGSSILFPCYDKTLLSFSSFLKCLLWNSSFLSPFLLRLWLHFLSLGTVYGPACPMIPSLIALFRTNLQREKSIEQPLQLAKVANEYTHASFWAKAGGLNRDEIEIVRKLRGICSTNSYTDNLPDSNAGSKLRHLLSTSTMV